MPCDLAGKRQSRCAHDGGKVPPRFFKLFVYNNIIELGPVAYLLAVDEMILAPVRFALARGPRGVGNRERELFVLGERGAHQGRLARARGRRDDEEISRHCHFTRRVVILLGDRTFRQLLHSIFWICSRICSISSLSSRLASESSFDTDFEPSVFASRLSSCIRKSSRLPTGPPPPTTRCTSSRCAPRRLSSSATSTLTP